MPSLRDWLTSKDRESWRGRARLLLEECTTEWQRESENPRYFSSPTQWFQIQCAVPSRHRSPASRRLLTKTARFYAERTSLAIAVILAPVVAWFGKEFCTFQTEFAKLKYDEQGEEVIITRRFDPRPAAWRFRQGTWIFKEDFRDQDAKDQIKGRLELNLGWSPDWSPLVPFLRNSRLAIAELEWLDQRVSVPKALLGEDGEDGTDIVGWGRAAPQPVNKALVALRPLVSLLRAAQNGLTSG